MRRIHHYTILELLVVVAIAAVILGIATPAFSVMMKGGAMTSTTRELAAKIKAARSYAAANNAHVALLFPTGKDCPLKPAFHSSVYRPCLVYKDGDGNWMFDSWIEGEPWRSMQKGIIMVPYPDNEPSASSSSIPKPDDKDFAKEEYDKLWDGLNSSEKELYLVKDVPLGALLKGPDKDNDDEYPVHRAIIFKPNGQLADVEVDKRLRFRLIEGTVLSGSDAKATATNVFTEGTATYLIAKTFTIHPLTCKMAIEDLKFKWTPGSSSLDDTKVN